MGDGGRRGCMVGVRMRGGGGGVDMQKYVDGRVN